MIFLTVGTQLPFDRLVSAVDDVAAALDEPVFGQIGLSKYQPQHFPFEARISPADFTARVAAARVVIGHAGIGTILNAKQSGKPVLVMARRANLGEHRNDHQSATAAQISKLRGVYLFETAQELSALLSREDLSPMAATPGDGLDRLLDRLRVEIPKGRRKRASA